MHEKGNNCSTGSATEYVATHGPEINTRTSGWNTCCRPFLQRYYKMSGRGRGRRGERRDSTIEEISSGGPACVIVVIIPPVEQLVRQSSQESGHSSGQGPSHGNSQKGFRRKQKRQASQFRKLKSPKQPKLHAGQCRAGQNVCYKCGFPGHIIKTCPKSRQLVTSRTYVMTTDQANPDPTAGTVKFAKKPPIEPDRVAVGLCVTVPSGEDLVSHDVF
ncbi:hypothetical protein F511_30703 [Dorcoceras hygrometricum]|uniref:CCHC-type domain-containing protein n=1 Tax=Dorcoceras hygrometricum TaxID=472368 RepID=A0A2Z7B304_9LAMI|nr:hypothetical protein F511_30703 [Dorcoceras hygrometricum]